MTQMSAQYQCLSYLNLLEPDPGLLEELGLRLAAGPKPITDNAVHGVRDLADLRRVVKRLRRGDPDAVDAP